MARNKAQQQRWLSSAAVLLDQSFPERLLRRSVCGATLQAGPPARLFAGRSNRPGLERTGQGPGCQDPPTRTRQEIKDC